MQQKNPKIPIEESPLNKTIKLKELTEDELHKSTK